jgi:hypothetical protein
MAELLHISLAHRRTAKYPYIPSGSKFKTRIKAVFLYRQILVSN